MPFHDICYVFSRKRMVFIVYKTFFYFFNGQCRVSRYSRHPSKVFPVMNSDKMAVTCDQKIYFYKCKTIFESVFDSFTRVGIQMSINIPAGMRDKRGC